MTEGAGGILQRADLINLRCYWRQKLIEYTSGLPDYIGCHYSEKAPTSDADWSVWKFTWVGSDCTKIEGPLSGAWDNRATLSW